MTTSTDARQVVEALAAHEDALNGVYTAYAAAYPDLAALWRTMAAEEHVHGKLLRTMLDDEEDVESYVEARAFDLDAVVRETARLRSFASLADQAGLSLQEALRSAVDFETSLVESEALTPTESDSPEVAAVLATLKEQTERHQRRLSESLATYRT